MLSTVVFNKCSEKNSYDYICGGISGAGMLKRHQHNAAVRKHGTITMLFQWRVSVEDSGSTLKQHWLNATCLRKIYNRPGDRLVLGQRRRRLTGIEPTIGCNAGPTLNRNLVGRPTSSVHRRQVLNECWPALAMVVEGIHVKDIWTCLLGFLLNYILDI